MTGQRDQFTTNDTKSLAILAADVDPVPRRPLGRPGKPA